MKCFCVYLPVLILLYVHFQCISSPTCYNAFCITEAVYTSKKFTVVLPAWEITKILYTE